MMTKFNGSSIEYEHIGHNVYISYFSTTNIKKAGIIERHRNPTGEWCEGSLNFEGTPGSGPTWQVVSLEPLTISPSVLCTQCGHHGWIKDGRWIPA